MSGSENAVVRGDGLLHGGAGVYAIYALRDPRNGQVRYVGKTIDLATRYKAHCFDPRRTNPRLRAWVLELRELGLKPEMETLCRSNSWSQPERDWIAHYRRHGHIFNIEAGGPSTYKQRHHQLKQKKRSSHARHQARTRAKARSVERVRSTSAGPPPDKLFWERHGYAMGSRKQKRA